MQQERNDKDTHHSPHHKGWRSPINDYSRKGLYHITMSVTDRQWLQPRRGGIDTALTLNALKGCLRRECHPSQLTGETASTSYSV